jgi:hypothetical protein
LKIDLHSTYLVWFKIVLSGGSVSNWLTGAGAGILNSGSGPLDINAWFYSSTEYRYLEDGGWTGSDEGDLSIDKYHLRSTSFLIGLFLEAS